MADAHCPLTGRARLGYDRARVLLDKYAGLDLHQLGRSAATHLGEAEVPLQLIMGKTRHKNPRTTMCSVKLGAEAIAAVTTHSRRPAVPTDQLFSWREGALSLLSPVLGLPP
ncbi:hypothetical protein OHA25_36435 [Nonomuraea sp. NBC_00507]|uniref:hypothetical protein n=1 Tax=Nonomuraea sp. NBC_00507 TaxID=2976002 RepID=UPI002E1805BF